MSKLRTQLHSIFVAGVWGATALALASCSDLEAPEPDAPAPPASTFDSSIPRAWFDLALILARTTPGFTPPVASRAFGYQGLTLYEAVVPGTPGHRSLRGIVNGLVVLPELEAGANAHWPSAANAALAYIVRALYSNTSEANKAAIQALEEENAAALLASAGPEAHLRGVAWGREVAEAVFAASFGDGGHEGQLRNFPESYVPPVGPGLWVPTSAQLIPLQPYWGSNRPFVLPVGNPNAAVDPGPPLAYSTDPGSTFYADALEVRDVGDGLTAEEQLIADYWSDGGGTITPGGHWISITTQVLEAENSSLADAAHAYALVAMAISDAFVSCWRTKYQYNILRPVTYIREVIGDATWSPFLTTPPFPEYSSGHSTQSAAASTVLAGLFGASYAFTDKTHVNATPSYAARPFASFDAAATEAATSRLYGGIHYRTANERGLAAGRKIGTAVLALPLHTGGA
jgi:hypothetical protein